MGPERRPRRGQAMGRAAARQRVQAGLLEPGLGTRPAPYALRCPALHLPSREAERRRFRALAARRCGALRRLLSLRGSQPSLPPGQKACPTYCPWTFCRALSWRLACRRRGVRPWVAAIPTPCCPCCRHLALGARAQTPAAGARGGATARRPARRPRRRRWWGPRRATPRCSRRSRRWRTWMQASRACCAALRLWSGSGRKRLFGVPELYATLRRAWK